MKMDNPWVIGFGILMGAKLAAVVVDAVADVTKFYKDPALYKEMEQKRQDEKTNRAALAVQKDDVFWNGNSAKIPEKK